MVSWPITTGSGGKITAGVDLWPDTPPQPPSSVEERWYQRNEAALMDCESAHSGWLVGRRAIEGVTGWSMGNGAHSGDEAWTTARGNHCRQVGTVLADVFTTSGISILNRDAARHRDQWIWFC